MDFIEGEILCFDKPLRWTRFDVVSKIRRQLTRRLGIKKLKVVFSPEEPLTPLMPAGDGGSRRAVPGSLAFVPSAAGLVMASEIVKDLTGPGR